MRHEFQTLNDVLYDSQNFKPMEFEQMCREHGIHEMCAIVPNTTDVYRDEQVETGRSLFGRKKFEPRRVRIGEEPVLHSNTVQNGINEASYRLVYSTVDDDRRSYIGYDGRPGNYITLDVILPETIARRLSASLAKNPLLLRKLIAQLSIRQLQAHGMQGTTMWETGDEHTRNNPLRPPYEAWADSDGTDKVYIHSIDASAGFNEQFIHTISTR